MAPLFAGASSDVLRSLEDAFRAGRLGASVSRMAMNRVCACPESVADDVMRLLGEGLSPGHMTLLLGAHADAMEARMSGALPLKLVWTGPEGANARSRDTSVVVRELFEKAQTSILVSTFVIRQGQRVLEPLARRMDLVPALRVQMFLHTGRDWRDTRHDSELLRECAGELRKAWPGTRYPDVYYDPRGLAVNSDERATWHPKCVLVDEEVAFVTSANFTEWAQTRNVEAGVVIRDRHFTEQLRAQFEGLVQGKQVARLPGF